MRVRRFSPTEIAYHWAQGLPYFACLGTGIAMLLLGDGTDAESREAAATIHLIAGAALVGFVLLVFLAGDRRRLLANLREGWRWDRRDLTWFVRAPLAGLGFPVEPPPSGRFNPGQKLHLLAQSLLVPSFALTGLVMWIGEGGLVFWFLHVALFCVLVPLLLGHLYFALVSRNTRKAIRGMLDGTVDRDWARHHHPLWLDPDDAAAVRPPSRRIPLVPIAVTFLVLAAALVWGARRSKGFRAGALGAVNEVGGIIEPGPLKGSHQSVSELADCSACHDLTGAPPDAKCNACHEEIRSARENMEGWHGGFEGSCAGCHRGHGNGSLIQLDRPAFNHRQARFDLRGAHRSLACESCHEEGPGKAGIAVRWQGLDFGSCSACHEDPHAGSLGGECTSCHTEDSWGGRSLRFRHDLDTSFPLTGLHRGMDCSGCHEKGFAGAGTGCVACHESPHQPGFEAECSACHSTRGWKAPEVRVDHSRFPLVGAHAALSCGSCHADGESHLGIGVGCADCHDDPHAGSLAPKGCTTCHDERTWEQTTFGHEGDSRFPLQGAHRALACNGCHESSVYRPLATGCSDCHEDPHRGSLAPKDCSTCHDERTWDRTTFSHDRDSRFPVRAAHRALECGSCHESRVYRPLASGCGDCHEDPHKGSLEPKRCTVCHDEKRWSPARFDHGRDARMALDAIHRPLDCAACHDSLAYRPLATGCDECHEDAAKVLRGEIGAGTVAGPAASPDPHDGRIACTDCHDPARGPADDVAMAKRCVECHAPPYGVLHLDRIRQLNLLLTKARGPEAARLARQAGHNFVLFSRLLHESIQSEARRR